MDAAMAAIRKDPSAAGPPHPATTAPQPPSSIPYYSPGVQDVTSSIRTREPAFLGAQLTYRDSLLGGLPLPRADRPGLDSRDSGDSYTGSVNITQAERYTHPYIPSRLSSAPDYASAVPAPPQGFQLADPGVMCQGGHDSPATGRYSEGYVVPPPVAFMNPSYQPRFAGPSGSSFQERFSQPPYRGDGQPWLDPSHSGFAPDAAGDHTALDMPRHSHEVTNDKGWGFDVFDAPYLEDEDDERRKKRNK